MDKLIVNRDPFQDEWVELFHKNHEGELIACEVIEEILDQGSNILYEHYLKSKSYGYTSKWMRKMLENNLRLCFINHEEPTEEEFRILDSNPLEEPLPSEMDNWATQQLPTRKKKVVPVEPVSLASTLTGQRKSSTKQTILKGKKDSSGVKNNVNNPILEHSTAPRMDLEEERLRAARIEPIQEINKSIPKLPVAEITPNSITKPSVAKEKQSPLSARLSKRSPTATNNNFKNHSNLPENAMNYNVLQQILPPLHIKVSKGPTTGVPESFKTPGGLPPSTDPNTSIKKKKNNRSEKPDKTQNSIAKGAQFLNKLANSPELSPTSPSSPTPLLSSPPLSASPTSSNTTQQFHQLLDSVLVNPGVTISVPGRVLAKNPLSKTSSQDAVDASSEWIKKIQNSSESTSVLPIPIDKASYDRLLAQIASNTGPSSPLGAKKKTG